MALSRRRASLTTSLTRGLATTLMHRAAKLRVLMLSSWKTSKYEGGERCRDHDRRGSTSFASHVVKETDNFALDQWPSGC